MMSGAGDRTVHTTVKNLTGKFGIRLQAMCQPFPHAPEDLQLINLVSGEAIPDDEPLFLLRGRDVLALPLLKHYAQLSGTIGCNSLHMEGLRLLINTFNAFRNQHPERMKQPTSSKHLKLENI